MDATRFHFQTLDKGIWLKELSNIRNGYSSSNYKNDIAFEFSEELSEKDIEPIHLVTLACLIQFFHDKGHKVWLRNSNKSVKDMLFNQLRFQEYWIGGKHHIDAKDESLFNLWRIVESEKDLYAKNVELYFKNTFFKGKDLSAISICMIEAFYNVFDHAQANGNAFSLIKYDEKSEKLNVAICDFGIGIAQSVRDFDPSISSDQEALLKSIEVDFTVRSKSHNAGKGLDNILNCSDVIRIISNGAFLLKNDNTKVFDLGYNFEGTLIYFDIDLSNAEDEEILDEFEF